MASKRLPLIAIAFGAISLILSWMLPTLFGGRQSWSEADAVRLQQAGARLHELTYSYGHAAQKVNSEQDTANPQAPAAGTEPGSPKPNSGRFAELRRLADELAEAKEQYGQLEQKLGHAQSSSQDAARIVRWVGIAAIALGAVGYFANRSRPA